MEDTNYVTGLDVGLSQEVQIRIALQCIVDNGGRASMERIFSAIESQMDDKALSEQGKNQLQKWISETAIGEGYVESDNNSDFRITPKGRKIVNDFLYAENVEDEEKISDDADEDIADPYDPSAIRVELTPFTIFYIMRKIHLEEINLHPDFQRHIVWDETRQSRLIESILIRVPLPAFYIDAVREDKWLVVDGLQRLNTLDRFFNKNELRLKNLEFLQELHGKTFKDLPRKFQRRIEETKL